MLPHQCINGKKITTLPFKNIFPFLLIYFFNLNFELYFFFLNKNDRSILKNKEEKNTKI